MTDKEVAKVHAMYRMIVGELKQINKLKKKNRKLEKENSFLKQQIEKMKNHHNCKWFHEWNLARAANEPFDVMSPCLCCKEFSLWELSDEKN